MKNKKQAILLFMTFCTTGAFAQESHTAAGGEATGSSGTVSYSVGQSIYTTNTGISESIAQGVQQPFEISIVTGINETAIDLEIAVFPNPTTNFLTLSIEEFQGLSFQLIDFQGKLIDSEELKENTSIIKTEGLKSGTYILNIISDDQSIKTFQIIKD